MTQESESQRRQASIAGLAMLELSKRGDMDWEGLVGIC